MRSFTPTPSRLNNTIHTAIATLILLAFWGMVAYSFRAALLPQALWLWQQVSGIGGSVVEGRYFRVLNQAGASRSKIDSLVSVLETDYRLILRYLDLSETEPVQILLTRGAGPPIALDGQLHLFFDGYNVNLDTAPVFLAMLAQGQGLEDSNLFLHGGYAIYLTEEIDRAQGLGQSSDAWVLLFQQQGALLPFTRAWQITMPTDEASSYDFGRALLQGGSFIRWLNEAYGPEAVQALRNGQRLEAVTGLYFDEAERQWLAALQSKEIRHYPCPTATLGKPWLQPFCERLAP